MYLSQTTVTLVLLMMLTGTLIYTTIDLQKDQILTQTVATSIDLKSSSTEHIIETAIPVAFNKVLNDMELRVIQSGVFYENESEVLNDLENRLESEINGNLESIKNEYSNEYNMTYNFNITNITMVDGFTFKVDYNLNYSLSRNNVVNKKDVSESQDITVKTILSAYHYVKSTKNLVEINSSSDLTDYQFKAVLTDNNFNFSKNKNGSGIKFIDESGNSIPYWIEYWRYTDDDIRNEKAIVWLKGNLTRGINYINITPTGTGVSDGGSVFELFEGFEDLESDFDSETIFHTTNVSGTWENDSLDSICYNSIYNEKMVKCEDAPVFSKVISDNDMNYYGASEYILEVNTKGNHSFSSFSAPNTMVGFFVTPDYYSGVSSDYPEDFYAADLGGISDNKEVYIEGGVLDADYYFENYALIHQYYTDKKGVFRVPLTNDPANLLQESTWYYVKLKINESSEEVSASFSGLDDYILGIDPTNELNYDITPIDNYLLLGTSVGSYYYVPNNYTQNIYFDNFRVRKYVQDEPEQIIRYSGLYYISPPRNYGTSYGTGDSENLYFIGDATEPSIIDMLAGKGSYDSPYWAYGYGIKLVEN